MKNMDKDLHRQAEIILESSIYISYNELVRSFFHCASVTGLDVVIIINGFLDNNPILTDKNTRFSDELIGLVLDMREKVSNGLGMDDVLIGCDEIYLAEIELISSRFNQAT